LAELRKRKEPVQPILRSDAIREWVGDRDPFDAVKAIGTEAVRAKEGRATRRFDINGEGYYAKLHLGVGWSEILSSLFRFRLPIIGASNEWNAINRFHEIGLDTLDAVAFAKRGPNPARQESFVITRELHTTIKLAEFCRRWSQPERSLPLKRALIHKVAEIARRMHDDGINHRDFYLCHFLLDVRPGVENLDPGSLRVYLLDLHRAQMRRAVPERWRVKDIASVYFSAMDVSLTRRDVFRFIRVYTGLPLREALRTKAAFWKKVRRRARQLYIRDWKRPPNELF
jgi:heptose I phosphotransferase